MWNGHNYIWIDRQYVLWLQQIYVMPDTSCWIWRNTYTPQQDVLEIDRDPNPKSQALDLLLDSLLVEQKFR